MWPAWTSMLSWWQWAILGAVPPAIVALYFLKLKRRPLEVPSTYLWRRTIEDLHVNSLWQRLRQNLLLYLQLAAVIALMLALLRPAWQARRLDAQRVILLVDQSASMSATDVAPSRLAVAKRQARAVIERLPPDGLAMIVSFAQRARVRQPFTASRRELLAALDAIEPTAEATSLDEALRVAAGMARAERGAEGEVVSTAAPQGAGGATSAARRSASVYLFSDGRFADVREAEFPSFELEFVQVGSESAANLAITAFAARPIDERGGRFEAFGNIENFSPEPASATVELLVDGQLVDAQRLDVAAGQSAGASFVLGEALEGAELELRLDHDDSQPLDNRAWVAIRPAAPVDILLVTAGNQPLELALTTARVGQVAEVRIVDPSYLATPEYEREAAAGKYALVIYDRVAPPRMPQANTLFVGALPEGWQATEQPVVGPQVIDVEAAHPLVRDLLLWDLRIREAHPLRLDALRGAVALVESHLGTLAAVAPREKFEDTVLAFPLVADDGANTDWPVKPSFPLFVLNLLEYFGHQRARSALDVVRPGQVVELHPANRPPQLAVTAPGGETFLVAPGGLDRYPFAATSQPGLYTVKEGPGRQWAFAVNLFDSQESDLAVRPESLVRIGYAEHSGRREVQAAPRELWKGLVVASLVVLAVEWYIYNRRVRA